jgi:hypothetical protein
MHIVVAPNILVSNWAAKESHFGASTAMRKSAAFEKPTTDVGKSTTVSRPAHCSKATISLAGFKSNDKILC